MSSIVGGDYEQNRIVKGVGVWTAESVIIASNDELTYIFNCFCFRDMDDVASCPAFGCVLLVGYNGHNVVLSVEDRKLGQIPQNTA